MLLRRVIQHVKTQNWTAVALDFIIVVVGVFIGIQVANWNDARADNSRIERRLENLADDLRADIVEIEYIAKTAAWRSSAVVEVLGRSGHQQAQQYETPNGTVIEPLPVPDYEAKLPTSAQNAMTWLSTLDGNRGAYEALVSTGDLHVMENVDLARRIQNYYARADEVYDQDRAHQDGRDLVTNSLHRNGIGILSNVTMDEIVLKVRGDLQLAADLSTLHALDDQQRVNMRELSDEANALISLIEGAK